jgi:hypothetical protein
LIREAKTEVYNIIFCQKTLAAVINWNQKTHSLKITIFLTLHFSAQTSKRLEQPFVVSSPDHHCEPFPSINHQLEVHLESVFTKHTSMASFDLSWIWVCWAKLLQLLINTNHKLHLFQAKAFKTTLFHSFLQIQVSFRPSLFPKSWGA